jgi:succinate dehydrogenase/fumarate reductase cytochrome b subunit
MDFTSKLSLYDVLTQLISGFLILALFIPKTISLQENFVFIIIFSYLIGVVYHRFLEWIRNIISKDFNKCFENCSIDLWIRTIFTRNSEGAIKKAKDKCKEDNKKNNKYYKIYYSIMDKPAYASIRILETQEAFLRNLTWIVLLYSRPSLKDNNIIAKDIISEISCWFILIFFFLILFARYHTQMKVYKAVWDAGKCDNVKKIGKCNKKRK